MAVATAGSMSEALEHVLTTAIDLQGAELGNVQLYDSDSGRLRIVAQHGFDSGFLERFASVTADDPTACGRALSSRQICQVPDVADDAEYGPYLEAATSAGHRAVQSMPLIARDGALVGVLSIHFREPRDFSDRDRQLGELLAHHAADLIASRAQQERLAALNATLSRRTAELESIQEQLAHQTSELLKQDRYRQEFLAALSHELRNPMAAIQGAVSLIDPGDPASKRAHSILERQTRHMTRLINDMLDMTRVRHGKLRLDRNGFLQPPTGPQPVGAR